jgi:hypothetical protein
MTGNAAPDGLTLTARVTPTEGVVFQQLQEEAVLLNLDSGLYFGLDPIGTRIWNLLAGGQSLPQVVSTIMAEYEVDTEQCTADLLKLLGDLEAHGLVSIQR